MREEEDILSLKTIHSVSTYDSESLSPDFLNGSPDDRKDNTSRSPTTRQGQEIWDICSKQNIHDDVFQCCCQVMFYLTEIELLLPALRSISGIQMVEFLFFLIPQTVDVEYSAGSILVLWLLYSKDPADFPSGLASDILENLQAFDQYQLQTFREHLLENQQGNRRALILYILGDVSKEDYERFRGEGDMNIVNPFWVLIARGTFRARDFTQPCRNEHAWNLGSGGRRQTDMRVSMISSAGVRTPGATLDHNDVEYLAKFVKKSGKVTLIGETEVGKSSLIQRLVYMEFTPAKTTIGASFLAHTVSYRNIVAHLEIWDTAGQERYRSVVTNYYRQAAAVLVCYDITSRTSFEAVSNYWIDQVLLVVPPDCILVIVGNKADLEQERQVSTAAGKNLARKYNCQFWETSAKTGKNIVEIFNKIASLIPETVQIRKSISLKKSQPVPRRKKGCPC